jgi:integrase
MTAAEPIRDKKTLHRMAEFWLERGNARNYAMIILGLYTALRIVDILSLKWDDVYDVRRKAFRSHIVIREKKTGKMKTIAVNPRVITALRLYMPKKRGDYIFASNRPGAKPITRVHAWRIIHTAAEAVRAKGRVSCHSLRKTFGYYAWKSGVMPVMLMDVFNHSSFEITRRYLGITQDDRDKVYLDIALV